MRKTERSTRHRAAGYGNLILYEGLLAREAPRFLVVRKQRIDRKKENGARCRAPFVRRSLLCLFVVVVKTTDADQGIDGKGKEDGTAVGLQPCTFTNSFHDLLLVFV